MICWNSPKASFWFWRCRIASSRRSASEFWTACSAAAPMASGSRRACCTAATTGAGWRGCIGIAATASVPLLATNEVLYHHPARRPLQDVLTCIREKTTIDAIGRRLEANAERYLKPGHEMARLFRDVPEAIAETMRFAGRISFSLDQLKYQYPDEPVPPGKTAQRIWRT